MPVNSSQPTITVKTADGKTVKMTLVEFRARQAVQSKPAEPAAHAEQAMQTKPVAQAEQAPQADKQIMQSKATSQKSITYHVSPITPPPITHDAKKLYPTPSTLHPTKETWEDDDHRSLLDISFEGDSSARLETAKESDDGKISSLVGRLALTWSLDERTANRLRTLIASRVKDIRTDDQVREYARRDTARGGLGMTDEHVDALMREVSGITGRTKKKSMSVSLPKTHEPVRAESIASSPPYVMPGRLAGSIPAPQKSVLHDVAPPAPPAAAVEYKESIGPVEEMRAIALADFRRLGRTPRDAADVLARKFAMAKDESFLLFLDAKDAWRESPLSREYFSLMTRSLGGEGTIAAIAGKVRGGGQMTSEEVMAIAGLNKILQ